MAQDAQQQWIAQVVARYERPLVAYALRLVGELELARDVVQDAFLRLCSQQRSAVEPHLAEWLFTVCRNRCLDHLRRPRTEIPMDDHHDQPASSAPGPAGAIEGEERAGRIGALVDALPPNQREVLRLKFQHGLSYAEISRITGLSESNVGFLIHVGIKALRGRVIADPALA